MRFGSLQAQGLRIVYSSAIVTPEMRGTGRASCYGNAEAAARGVARAARSEGVETGQGRTIQIVRAPPAASTEAPRTAVHGTIEGWVTDALTGVRLPDVLVRVDGGPQQAGTDAAGRFLLRRVSAGSTLLLASAAGYTPDTQTVRVDDRKTTNVTLSLSPSSMALQRIRVGHRAASGLEETRAWQPESRFDRAELGADVWQSRRRSCSCRPGICARDARRRRAKRIRGQGERVSSRQLRRSMACPRIGFSTPLYGRGSDGIAS